MVSLSYSGSSLALARLSKVWFVSVLVSFVCVQARLRGRSRLPMILSRDFAYDTEPACRRGIRRSLSSVVTAPSYRSEAGPDGLTVFVLRRACAQCALRAAQALSVGSGAGVQCAGLRCLAACLRFPRSASASATGSSTWISLQWPPPTVR